ncbi:MAG TPA: glycerol-3-phosphate dehydrogenase/oxidase [Candidatus Obscuribacterales bacterium]
MRRDPAALAGQTWDVLVIGGGITGACIAWDAAQRGLKVALVDMADFASATSAAPSKLIHGGLRYLKNLEFGLVRESLRERRIMEIIAPHQVVPLPFILPAYGWGNKTGLPLLGAAMLLYEGLSYDKGWLEEKSQQLGMVRPLTRKGLLEMVPDLPTQHLTGGFVYYDCQMLAPERLTLDFLLSAAEHGASLANYCQVTGFDIRDGAMQGVQLRDRLTGESHTLRARVTINASGPWADLLLGLMEGDPAKKLLRSKGIHILTRQLIKGHYALTLATPGGRHLFLIPWRGHTLIGTTDKPYHGHPDDFRVTESDIIELIDEVNELMPAARLSMEDVKYFYGGLRPLVEAETSVKAESYQLSRKFEIYDHCERGLAGFLTVIGGKYTTARLLAEQTVDRIYAKLDLPGVPCRTAETPVWGRSSVKHYNELVAQLRQRYPLLPQALLSHLCHSYGARAAQLLERALNQPGMLEPLWRAEPDIVAEVHHALEQEMACRLDDVLFRRTGLGTLGRPPQAMLQRVAEIMAAHHGWDAAQQAEEIARVLKRYQPQTDAAVPV